MMFKRTLLLIILQVMIASAQDSTCSTPYSEPVKNENHSPSPPFFAHLLNIGQSDLAAFEYKRDHQSHSLNGTDAVSKLGNELLHDGDFKLAEDIFEDLLEQDATDSSTYTTAKHGLIRTYLLQRKPNLALNELATFDPGIPLDKNAVRFYKGVIHAASYRVDSSENDLNMITGQSPFSDKARQLKDLMAWYQSNNMKNPLTAYVYSSALPGMGHWYLGDRKKAAKSFLLMTGLSALIGYEGYRFYRSDSNRRFVYGMDIFLVWGFAWRRYYNSIRKAAHQQAVAYNQSVQIEYQKRLHSILLN